MTTKNLKKSITNNQLKIKPSSLTYKPSGLTSIPSGLNPQRQENKLNQTNLKKIKIKFKIPSITKRIYYLHYI